MLESNVGRCRDENLASQRHKVAPRCSEKQIKTFHLNVEGAKNWRNKYVCSSKTGYGIQKYIVLWHNLSYMVLCPPYIYHYYIIMITLRVTF